MSLGKNIRALREHRGWTLEDLSSKTSNEVDVGTIHALEKRGSSRSRYAPHLAKAFNIPLENLLSEVFSVESYPVLNDDDLTYDEVTLLRRKEGNVALHVGDSEVLDLMDELLRHIAPGRRTAAGEILASWAREGGGEHWKKAFQALVTAKQTDSPAAA